MTTGEEGPETKECGWETGCLLCFPSRLYCILGCFLPTLLGLSLLVYFVFLNGCITAILVDLQMTSFDLPGMSGGSGTSGGGSACAPGTGGSSIIPCIPTGGTGSGTSGTPQQCQPGTGGASIIPCIPTGGRRLLGGGKGIPGTKPVALYPVVVPLPVTPSSSSLTSAPTVTVLDRGSRRPPGRIEPQIQPQRQICDRKHQLFLGDGGQRQGSAPHMSVLFSKLCVACGRLRLFTVELPWRRVC